MARVVHRFRALEGAEVRWKAAHCVQGVDAHFAASVVWRAAVAARSTRRRCGTSMPIPVDIREYRSAPDISPRVAHMAGCAQLAA